MRANPPRRHLTLPQSRWLRISLGVALVFGGLLGFLPVVGFWMLPLGILVLSVDIPSVRRRRRALAVRLGRRRQEKRAARRRCRTSGSESAPR